MWSLCAEANALAGKFFAGRSRVENGVLNISMGIQAYDGPVCARRPACRKIKRYTEYSHQCAKQKENVWKASDKLVIKVSERMRRDSRAHYYFPSSCIVESSMHHFVGIGLVKPNLVLIKQKSYMCFDFTHVARVL